MVCAAEDIANAANTEDPQIKAYLLKSAALSEALAARLRDDQDKKP